MSRKLFIILGLIIIAPTVFGVNTAYWEVNTKAELAKGEFENAILTPAGEVVLGKTPAKVGLAGELSLWCGAMDSKGTYYFGSGSGKIYKLSEKEDKLDEFFATTETLITALAVSPDNELFAATIPNGRIYKIGKDGKGAPFCQLPIAYVWALGFGPDDALYASTGPVANIYKIKPDGKFEALYESKKGMHILSFLFDENTLYFGTSYPAILHRYNMKEKKAEILYDFGDSEIKSIALSSDKQSLYLAINSGIKMMPQDFLGAVKGAAEEAKKPDLPVPIAAPLPPPKEKPPVQSSIYAFTLPNKVRELSRFDKCYITDLKYVSKNSQSYLLAATDNSGKIYQVTTTDANFSIPYDLEANNILALLMDKKGELKIAAAGGVSGVYLFPANDVTNGSYTSDVFDARFIAEWGSAQWENSKDVALSVRTGNTNKPDDTWSAWSDEITASPAKLDVKPGRYIQLKAKLNSKDAALSKFALAYLVANQSPKMVDVRIENVKKPLEGQPASPFLPQRVFARKIVYQANDPDGDPLGYRIYYRKESQTQWVLVNQNDLIATPEFVWNTESMDDGKYLIKVEATDERNNPDGRSLSDSKTSKQIIVDNTKPTIKSLTTNGKDCSGEVEDNFNYIARIEYSLDGQPWTVVYPNDTLFDARTEKFAFQLKDIAKGTHSITLRVFDADGNLGTRQEEFTAK